MEVDGASLRRPVALVSIGGMIRLSTKIAYRSVRRCDGFPRPHHGGRTGGRNGIHSDDRLKRATLFNWVEDLRTVTTDGIAQRKAIDRVYAHIASGGQSQAFISEFYRADPPQKRASAETVSVEVRSVLPTSERTFEVEWIETTRDLYGAVKGQDHWKAAFTIAVNPPTGRADGPHQSARDLRHERQLGQGSLKTKGKTNANSSIISILAVGTSVALVGQQNVRSAGPSQAASAGEIDAEGNVLPMTPTLIATISERKSPRSRIPAAVKTGAGSESNAMPVSVNRFCRAGRIQTEDRCAAHEDGAGRGSDQREVDGGA